MRLDKVFQAFSIRDLQAFKNIVFKMRQKSVPLTLLMNYIQHITNVQRIRYYKACPACTSKMILYSVNTTKCDQVGGNLKSQWVCHNCSYEEFSKNNRETEIKGLRRCK